MKNVFLTEQDPNYRVKGSRDPLGFQVVWARTGRHLIKHLSTVSLSIRDFQTLLYGHFLFRKITDDPRQLLTFFLKFEQASGFARRLHLENDVSFNGLEFVKKVLVSNPDRYWFSTTPQDTILSNQKAYGVWGKYNRPFNDMRLMAQPGVENMLDSAIRTKTDLGTLLDFARRLLENERATCSSDELKPLSRIYDVLAPEETIFFREHLLKVNGEAHLQNDLFELCSREDELCDDGNFHVFGLLEKILGLESVPSGLRTCLENIRATERVLFRLNSIFRGTQTRSIWTHDELDQDVDLREFNQPVEYQFKDQELNELNSYLSKDLVSTTKQLIERNDRVCSRRGKVSWIKEEGGKFRVYYQEGAGRASVDGYDNSYFLHSYLTLFRQVEKGTL